MSSDVINWGVIGTGYMAHQFMNNIENLSNHNIKCVYTRNPKIYANKNQRDFRYLHVDELTGSHEDGLIDAIYIATPLNTHFKYVHTCLSKKLAVLCEKPLFFTYSEYEEIYRLLTKNKGLLMEGNWMLHLPHIRAIDEIISGDSLGKPKRFSTKLLRNYDLTRDNRILSKELGGGAFNEMAVYGIALAYRLFGRPQVTSHYTGILRKAVDLEAFITLKHENNMITEVFTSFVNSTASSSLIEFEFGEVTWGDLLKGKNEIHVKNFDKKKNSIISLPNLGQKPMIDVFFNLFVQSKFESNLECYIQTLEIGKILCKIREKDGFKTYV